MYAFALHDAGTGAPDHRAATASASSPCSMCGCRTASPSPRRSRPCCPIPPQGPRGPALLPCASSCRISSASGEDTVITGIRRVSPGEALIIDTGLAVPAPPLLVRPGGARRGPGGWTRPRRSWIGSMDQAKRPAYALGRPLRSFLPGGTDSAILVVVSRGPGGWTDQELLGRLPGCIARRTSWTRRRASPADFGLDHQALRLALPRVFGRIPHTIWSADELMRDYASLPTSSTWPRPRVRGSRWSFGEGGDEVFSGRLPALPPEPRLSVGSRPCAIRAAGDSVPAGNGPVAWSRRLFGPALPGRRGARPATLSRRLGPDAPEGLVGPPSGASTWTWSRPCRTTCWSRPTAC